MCDNGSVLVNEHEAKPAKEVQPGDVITLRFSSRIVTIEIIGIPAASSGKGPPGGIYRVKSEQRTMKEADPWSKNPSLH